MDCPSLEKRKKDNHILLQVARPSIEKLVQFFKEMNVIFLLTDADGYVLFQDGNKDGLAEAEVIRFVEGVQWTEERVGTNAIGTSLRTGEPMTIIGPEHYAVASQSWSCSAAPIHHPDGRLIGILDASAPGCDKSFQQYILPMIVTTAYVIEEQLGRKQAEDERDLLRYAASLRPSPSAGQLICSPDGTIKWMSPHCRTMFTGWEEKKIQSCLQKSGIQKKSPIVSSQDGRPAGYLLELNEGMFADKKLLKETDIFPFYGVKGTSETFARALAMMKRAASSNVPVHIHGETGTGKELAARTIHRNSPRSNQSFVAVNCGAIPKELMESELFGYAAGAFTGAKRGGHKGFLEQAHRGTLFLDEIGDISYDMQVALLRALQEKEVIPLGADRAVPIDVRLVTATHRDLRELVNQGIIREDLFYRLFVYPIDLPPLRERKEDIPFFIQYYCNEKRWHTKFPEALIEQLMDYEWRGNIRELFNVLDRLSIDFQNGWPEQIDLWPVFTPQVNSPDSEENPSFTLSGPRFLRDKADRERMRQALEQTEGHVTRAAELLNMPRSTFYRKLKKFGL